MTVFFLFIFFFPPGLIERGKMMNSNTSGRVTSLSMEDYWRHLDFKIRMPFGSSRCLMLKEFHFSHLHLHHEVPQTTRSSKNSLRIHELKAALNSGWKVFHREKVLFKSATSLKVSGLSVVISASEIYQSMPRYLEKTNYQRKNIYKDQASSSLKRKVVDHKRSILRYDSSVLCQD